MVMPHTGTTCYAGGANQAWKSEVQQSGLSPRRAGTGVFKRRGRQCGLYITVSDPVLAVAVHPRTLEIFAGTRHGAIALLDRRQGALAAS